MAQVFKIKFDNTLRRISVPLFTDIDAKGFSYEDLELKIRDLFQIPSTFRVLLTYTDGEDDVVTMADNQDLKDACLMQKLNPLKLELKTVPLQTGIKAKGNESRLNTTEFNVEALLKGLLPESTAKAIDQVLSRYPPCLFTTVPAHVLPEALDTFLGTLAAGNTENATKLQRDDRVIAPGIAVHKYIECDNCCLCPIVGPRYKSIKKHDYDLCSNCFKEVGNATDYHKLDRPLIAVSQNPEMSFKSANDLCFFSSACRTHSSRGPFGRVSPKHKDLKGIDRRLDAEFVMDVTILDGSKVEVNSTFTKVWRLRNCGALPWPQHTKLVHIGGTMLGATGVVTLKLPEGGLPSDSELDVSVELKAPESTGRYVANWRLRTPSGQMFGHSVWVLVEAVPVCNKSQMCESEESHFSEESHDDKELKDSLFEEAKTSDSLVSDANGGEEGNIADLGLGEGGLKVASMLLNVKEQYGETDGFSLVESVDNRPGEECEATEDFELVSSLAHEFTSGEFGIKQNDANIEPCQNSFSEDDSLASTGWDHMLKELEELGFNDRQTNVNIKELLLKSEGSIKKAVKELVELEKQMSGKIKAA